MAAPGFSCGMQDLVPWPGIKPGPPALGAQSLNFWTTREVPCPGILSGNIPEWLGELNIFILFNQCGWWEWPLQSAFMMGTPDSHFSVLLSQVNITLCASLSASVPQDQSSQTFLMLNLEVKIRQLESLWNRGVGEIFFSYPRLDWRSFN